MHQHSSPINFPPVFSFILIHHFLCVWALKHTDTPSFLAQSRHTLVPLTGVCASRLCLSGSFCLRQWPVSGRKTDHEHCVEGIFLKSCASGHARTERPDVPDANRGAHSRQRQEAKASMASSGLWTSYPQPKDECCPMLSLNKKEKKDDYKASWETKTKYS